MSSKDFWYRNDGVSFDGSAATMKRRDAKSGLNHAFNTDTKLFSQIANGRAASRGPTRGRGGFGRRRLRGAADAAGRAPCEVGRRA